MISALLDAARRIGDETVVVLGHADYYPRFGFVPASRFGISAPVTVPDDSFLALPLTAAARVPSGVISYPAAFGL